MLPFGSAHGMMVLTNQVAQTTWLQGPGTASLSHRAELVSRVWVTSYLYAQRHLLKRGISFTDTWLHFCFQNSSQVKWNTLRAVPSFGCHLHTPTTTKSRFGGGRSYPALPSINSAYLQAPLQQPLLFCGIGMGLIKRYFVRAISLHFTFYKITNKTSNHQHVKTDADLK